MNFNHTHHRTRRLMLHAGLAASTLTLIACETSHQAAYYPPHHAQPTASTHHAGEASSYPHDERDPIQRGIERRAQEQDFELVLFNGQEHLAINGQTQREHAPQRRSGATSLFGEIDGTRTYSSGAEHPTENLRRITFTSEGADFDPAVTPDGETIVFASTRHRETANLYRKQVRGNTITQLTSDPANDVTPAVSPNGELIAFASDRSGSYDIYIMDARGGQPVQLTNEDTHDVHPSFSPDGRKLVYSSFGGPSGQWEMVIIELDNPGTRHFIGHGLFPQWSPVDDRIVFQRARQRGTRWFSAWTLELDENGQASAPTEVIASANAAIITPRWSPDGKHLVFSTVQDPTNGAAHPEVADVWIVGADGAGRARLTTGQHANLQPVWSTSGEIYFVSNRKPAGAENIWALRPDRALHLAEQQLQSEESAAFMPTR